MHSKLKRYIFKSGLDIVAPLKCGTRWLEGLDVDTRIDTIQFHIEDISNHIHSGTTFIWRPVREHFVSALTTELSVWPDKSPFDVISEMEEGICDHWCTYLYKKLYTIWSKTPFRFHKLRALSELTPTARELKYVSTAYDFHLPIQWDGIEHILSSISPKHIIRLERLISEEEKWLELMIESQYSKKDWKDYSDLEDSRLEMLCKVMDLETEIERIKINNYIKII
jgi:hypothetical protein